MSTITIACIIAGAGIAITLLKLSEAYNNKNKNMSQLLKRFSTLGTFYNLSFSSQELLSDSIIGLDGISRKLLILVQLNKTLFDDFVVDLDEVKSCTVKKYYGNIKPGDLKNKKLETYGEQIALCFEFNDGREAVEIPFYKHRAKKRFHWVRLEQKAGQWKQILTKMLRGGLKEAT